MRKISLFLFILLLIASGGLAGFTSPENKQENNCIIMFGVAYQQKKCTSGSTSNSFSQAQGYRIAYSTNSSDYKKVSAKVKGGLADAYNVAEKDISIKSGSKSIAVVIKYEKQISGWNCSVTRYIAGYGNTVEEAEAHAAKQKNNDTSKGNYTVVETLSCK